MGKRPSYKKVFFEFKISKSFKKEKKDLENGKRKIEILFNIESLFKSINKAQFDNKMKILTLIKYLKN